jgi:hypothetical protein
MKKIFFSFLVVAAISFTACKDNKKPDEAKTPQKTEEIKPTMAAEKDHVCTDKCKDGVHVYAHGEKGHVCTEECAKMNM